MNEDLIEQEVKAARYRWLGEGRPEHIVQETPTTEQEAELLRRRDTELIRQSTDALIISSVRRAKGLAAVATTDVILDEALVENLRRDLKSKSKKK